MAYSVPNASAATQTHLRTRHNFSRLSGMCATCLDGCPGYCEVGTSAYRASEAVRRIIGRSELPGRLREMDLAIDDLVDVSDTASSLEMSASAPAPHTASDLYDLIKQAF